MKQIAKIIKNLGIKKSDIVLLQLDTDFFKIAPDQNKKECSEALLDAIFEVIGDDGTLITPSFNYAFCKTGKFDLHKTPSQVGYFSNYLLTKPNFFRSLHPIFSFVGAGKNIQNIINDISKDAFGEKSVFDKLYNMGAKGLYINLPEGNPDDCAPSTFVHYIEQKFGVDYRYLKTFAGEITIGDKTYLDQFTFNVRNYDLDVKTNNIGLYKNAIASGIARTAMLNNNYPLVVADIKSIVDLGISMLKENSYSLLLKNPYLK